MEKVVFITGIAGFIGFHTALKYKGAGWDVYGIDDFNGYYDPRLKHERANILRQQEIGVFPGHLSDERAMTSMIKTRNPSLVIHLAASAGVRHSMDNPSHYIANNIVGTQNLINACEKAKVENIIYASTSCVMHDNPLPWNEHDKLNPALSPYGYTKACNEQQMAISHIPNAVGLRFFTVYGPWGRPDMALFDFTKDIVAGNTITLFNYGEMYRDFTYVDDIVNGIFTVSKNMTKRDIYCIGNGMQTNLMDFVGMIEEKLGMKVKYEFAPKHPADAKETWSDTSKLRALGWEPTIGIREGVGHFIDWYTEKYIGYDS